MSRKGVDWGRVDWSRQDADLARELGVSRQRVGQKRRELGYRRALSPHDRRVGRVLADPTVRSVGGWARVLGVSRRTAGRALADAGRAEEAARAGRRRLWKIDWDAVDWSKTDSQLAKELPVALSAIQGHRKRRERDGLL